MKNRASDVKKSILTRFRRLGGELIWVTMGQCIAAVGSLVGVRLLTNVLSPEVYGELALGLTVATLVNQTVLSPLYAGVLRFFAPAQEANQFNSYLQGVRFLTVQATIVLLTVFSLVSIILLSLDQIKWLWLILAALLFSLLSGYSAGLDGMQNAARQRSIVAWHQGLGQWLRFLIALPLIGWLGMYSYIAMFGYALASGVVLCSQFLFFRSQILPISREGLPAQKNDIRAWNQQIRNYIWPFCTFGLFTWAQTSSERWALQTFSTTSDVGFYAVLYQLGYYPIILVFGVMTQLLMPVLFDRAGDGSNLTRIGHTRHLIKLLTLFTLILTLTATIITLVFHVQIFSFLVAPEYRKISDLLPLMVLSSGIFACGQAISLIPMSTNKTQVLIVPKIATALLGVVLNIIGAKLANLNGILVASLIFSTTYFTWMLLQLQPIQFNK